MSNWLRSAQDVIFISLWVGICTVVPEIVWQGGLLVFKHHELVDVLISAAVGSCFLFFFIEPLIERLKHLSWSADHDTKSWTFARFLLFMLFGVAAVCLHECIEALIHASSVGPQKSKGVHHAVVLMAQWAFIPFILAFTWLVGNVHRKLGNSLSVVAPIAIMLTTTQLFGWRPVNAFILAGASLAMSVVMVNMPRNLRFAESRIPGPFPETPYIAAFLLIQLSLVMFTSNFYGLSFEGMDYGEHIRFYIGWTCGLLFAPRPYYLRKYNEATSPCRPLAAG